MSEPHSEEAWAVLLTETDEKPAQFGKTDCHCGGLALFKSEQAARKDADDFVRVAKPVRVRITEVE